MLQQFGDPLGIFHIAFAPRYEFDVLGVDQQHLKVPLEEIEHGFPVHPGRFHRYVRHAPHPQPVCQPQQLGRRRPKGAHLHLPVLIGSR